nr:hypothetical protein [Tanacetum cinerariifolium]
MIGDAEETKNENPTNDALETQADEVQGEISFHAISETILPQTLRLPERIQNKDVVVLVDGGSTHNFVDQERTDESRESDFGTVPTMLLYGRLPPKLVPYIPGTASVKEVDEYLQDRDSLLKHLRKNLLNAQDHMKANANRHRRNLEFKEGEFVLVKLQPYRQVSIANRLSVKLSPSFLRRFIGPLPAVVSELKEVSKPLEIPSDPQPEKILEERVITKAKYRPKTEAMKWGPQKSEALDTAPFAPVLSQA